MMQLSNKAHLQRHTQQLRAFAGDDAVVQQGIVICIETLSGARSRWKYTYMYVIL